MINDGVILDTKNARDFLKKKGKEEIYRVFHFAVDGLSCDFTLLRHGVFSLYDRGELFLTYGHLHSNRIGEVYVVLKNDCFFELSDKDTSKTFIIYVRKGDAIFIHPRFLHRIISFRKDCLVLNFLPSQIKHNYNVIKNKGFPVHMLYLKKGVLCLIRNKKYGKAKFKLVKRIGTKVNPIALFEKDPTKLKDILVNPDKYKKLYFIGE